MFRHLDRYVIKEIVSPFALALLVFTFILMTPPIARSAQEFLAKGVELPVIAKALLLLVPQALAVTIPMAFLLGVLVAFGRLSGDSEWVAMQACGVSLFRMLRPVLVTALVAWGATQWVMLTGVPWCNQAYREIEYNVLASIAEGEIKPRVFFDRFPGLVLYARDVTPGVPGWSDVFVAEVGRPGQPGVYLARHGRMLVDREQKTVRMTLADGIQHSVTVDPATGKEKYEVNRFNSLILNIDPSRVFSAGPGKNETEMTVTELRARAEQLRKAGDSPHNAIWSIHQKFALPVTCLVFALIGLGFGVSGARSGKLAAFTVGIAVIFAYYSVMALTQSLVKGKYLAPAIGPWVPNIVLGLFGAIVLMTRGRWGGFSMGLRLPRPVARVVNRFRGLPPESNGQPADGRSRPNRVVVVLRFPHLGLPRPSLLDRYIGVIYTRFLALTFVSLLGIFYIASFIDMSEKLFKGKTTMGTLLQFLWYATPQFVYYVVPIAALLATLITIGILTRNSELVVMKACGVSLYRVSVPLLAFGAAASLVLFAMQEQVLASANSRAEDLRQMIRTGQSRTLSLPIPWVAGQNGEFYHYQFFDPRRKVLTALSIYEFDESKWQLRRRTYLETATFGAGGMWTGGAGWVRELDARGDTASFTTFPSRRLTLERPDYFGSEQPEADRMSYGELRRYIDRMGANGMNVVPYLVSLHQKLSFPFATVIVTLIAIPFAVTTGRRGALYGLGVGIALAMIYWTANNAFGAIGSAGLVAPILAAWAPNILFGASASYMLLTVKT